MAAADSTINEFKEHVRQYIKMHECFGYTSFGGADRVEFVPHDALAQFWTVEVVRAVLWSGQSRVTTDAQHIIDKYLVAFSILAWMEKPGDITKIMDLNIGDHILPIDESLIQGTEQPDMKELLLEFSKNQWKFSPLILDCRPLKRRLNPYHIVPIANKQRLDIATDEDDEDVRVYKAQWHGLCLGSLPSSYVVLKEYSVPNHDSAAYKMLSNEVDIYTSLDDGAFEYVIRYYGSFVQQGKFTLILEYASKGTLLDYFETMPRPRTCLERTRFWQRFFSLLPALAYIHQLCTFKDNVLKGVHQDIRPQNIFVVSEPDGNPSDFRFKLADFGTGHVRKCRNGGLDSLAAQRTTNGMYSSPESCRDDGKLKPQSPQCDVWSLGAVASEALVWSIQGEDGRRIYQNDRCKKSEETPLKGGFHEGSFHDGTCRLPVVEEQHRAVLGLVGDDDHISAEVSGIILNYMLIANPHDGFTADAIFGEWEETLAHVSPPYSPREKRASIGRKTTRVSQNRSSMKRNSTHSAYWASQIADYPEGTLSEEPVNMPFLSFSGEDHHIPEPQSRLSTYSGQTPHRHSRQLTLNRSGPFHSVGTPSQLSGLHIQAQPPARSFTPAAAQTPTTAAYLPTGFPRKSPTITTITAVLPDRPVITIDDVYTKYIKAKSKMFHLRRGSKASGPFALFPSLKDNLQELRGYGNGRDQFFIIDDSQSMKRHQDQLGKTVRVLAHLLKKGKVDPNKTMELYYICKTEHLIAVDSSDFQENIDAHIFSDGACNIFQRLDQIATEILKNNGNRVSIYILTNGRWNAQGQDDLCGVDRVIKRLLNDVKKGDKESNHVAVQFIRFYQANSPEDDEGRARLEYLDDNLAEEFRRENLGFARGDIVDTTDWDGDVGKMLLGGVFSEIDGREAGTC